MPDSSSPVPTTVDEDKVLQAIDTVASDGATSVVPLLSSPWRCKVYKVGDNVVRADFVKPKKNSKEQ